LCNSRDNEVLVERNDLSGCDVNASWSDNGRWVMVSPDEWWLAYILVGMFSGFIAGLLGIGGGVVIVSVLTMMFDAQGVAHQHILHMALGTSMATIIFTATASVRAHHAHGAVFWPVVRTALPGVLIGTLLGTQLASLASTYALSLFFGLFMLCIAAQMAFSMHAKPGRTLPGRAGIVTAGGVIGCISALVAINGGSLTVSCMTWCNVRIQDAIGTAAALGLPIAIFGTLGYLWNGWGVEGLPEGTIGYVYIPALVCLMLSSSLTAPLGARMTHRLPVLRLRKIFAGLLVVLAAKMLWRVWS
jgi:uncharacterized protein